MRKCNFILKRSMSQKNDFMLNVIVLEGNITFEFITLYFKRF